MKKMTLLLLGAILLHPATQAQAPSSAPAQTQAPAAAGFPGFADDNHARMVRAYEQRDIPGYRRALDGTISPAIPSRSTRPGTSQSSFSFHLARWRSSRWPPSSCSLSFSANAAEPGGRKQPAKSSIWN